MQQTTSLAELVNRDDVRARVDAALVGELDGLARETVVLSEENAELVAELRSFVAGGKRMRAAFAYWSWRAHGPGPEATDASILAAGAAIELFQASALFHDDVIDASASRRGAPTAHVAFARRHAEREWLGDPERFGLGTAVLLGDLALVTANRALAPVAETTAGRRAIELFGRMQTEVVAGQYLDLAGQSRPFAADPTADEARARIVIRSKSARYSVEYPLLIGAALAGADEEALTRMSAAGLPLGEAFQLRDDVLGVFGDTATTGKPAGDDIREGKRTVLVAKALAAATPAQRQALLAALGAPDLDTATLDAARAALVATGAVDAVEELIAHLAGKASDALASARLEEPAAGVLRELAAAATYRAA